MNSIDDFVSDMAPVSPVRPSAALFAVGLSLSAAIIIVWFNFGLRSDILAGTPQPMVLIRSGTLLLLGFSALAAVVAAARPGVGQVSHGWRWALAAAALFPIASLFLSILDQSMPMADIKSPSGPWCLAISMTSALMIGAVLTRWLRRGAPTSLNRTAWLVGLAAGAFGTFAYSLHCPSTSVHYVGIWYCAAIALCAVAGRIIVPPFIRW